MKTRIMWKNGPKEMTEEEFWKIITDMSSEEQKQNFYNAWHFAPTVQEWERYQTYRSNGYRNK